KVGEQIVKVQCKQCGGYHRHRPPGSSERASRSTGTRARRAAASSSATAPRAHEPQVEADLSRPIKPYRFDGEYEPGDRIEHPKFGDGVVEVTGEPGKMQVFFSDGRRVLARAKPRSGLERPKPFQLPSAGDQEP